MKTIAFAQLNSRVPRLEYLPRAPDRHNRAFDLLRHKIIAAFGSVEKFKELLPETATMQVDRHPLPALRSVNFVIHGLLEEGVAASTRQDGQAKSLGEWLRARVVEMPEALLP